MRLRSVLRLALLGACIVVGLPLVLGGVVRLFYAESVGLDARELGDLAVEAVGCVRTELPVYSDAAYNRERGANDYLAYAVASWNAYYDGPDQRYVLTKHSPQWKKIERVTRPGGLVLDYYFDDTHPDLLSVLVAFRGTDISDVGDWISNLSWITYWLPFPNQYDQARDVFRDIRRRARQAAGDRKVTFVTTGHSLGGGLAQHIAFGFPCTSAAVFDGSFVVNKFLLAPPVESAQVVNIYEDRDELSRVRRLLRFDTETEEYRQFNMNVVVNQPLEHELLRLTVGMAGMVVNCQGQSKYKCAIPAADQRARNLYCPTYGMNDAVCRTNRSRLSPR